jgi:hypothetical protein
LKVNADALLSLRIRLVNSSKIFDNKKIEVTIQSFVGGNAGNFVAVIGGMEAFSPEGL